ncbi:MAG: flippase [archaeon]
MASYMRRAITSTSIIYGFAIVGALFAYLLRILFARNLTVTEYGLFYAVYAAVSLVISFSSIGLGTAITRYIPEFKIKKRFDDIKSSLVLTLVVQLIFSAIVLVLFFLFADYLAMHYFKDQTASLILKLVVVGLTIKCVVDTLRWGFIGFQRFLEYSAIFHLSLLSVFLMSVVMFKCNLGYLVPALAYLIYPILFIAIFLPIFLKKTFPAFFSKKIKFDKLLIIKLMKFGLPQLIVESSILVLTMIDTVILTVMVGVVGVGIYNVALPTARLILFFGEGLGVFLLPFVSELWVRNHKTQLNEGIKLIYKYLFMLIVPLSLMIFAFADVIVTLLFGPEYYLAVNPLRVLVVGLVFYSFFNVNSSVFSGINKPEINARLMLIGVLFNVVANILLIKYFTVTGAAIACALTFAVMLVLSMFYLKKFLTLALPIVYWLKIAVISVVVTLLAFVLKHQFSLNPYLESVLIGVLCGSVYLVLILITKLLDVGEIKSIINQAREK